MKLRNLFMLVIVSSMLVACGTSGQDVVYMQNIDKLPSSTLSATATQAGDFTIKPGDLLLINVGSSNYDAAKPFNKLQYVPTIGTNNNNLGDMTTIYYLVDDNGNIDFPVLGKLHIAGMTKKSIEEYISSLIYPRYLTESPNVECRIQNFRVFCIGEFNAPGIIQASNGRLNLIEAIAMCHDLTLQGQRDNIMLIRTDPSGERTVKRVNINDASFISSPEFDLQQNDILYVEPNKYKKRSIWSLPPLYSAGVSIFGTLVSVITFVTVLAKK